MNLLKTTEDSSGINSEKSSPLGDLRRGKGPAVAMWLEMREKPAELQEDLFPAPREEGEGHKIQLRWCENSPTWPLGF